MEATTILGQIYRVPNSNSVASLDRYEIDRLKHINGR